jgi:hypothetical protein
MTCSEHETGQQERKRAFIFKHDEEIPSLICPHGNYNTATNPNT